MGIICKNLKRNPGLFFRIGDDYRGIVVQEAS
jgi:hypothetical protein